MVTNMAAGDVEGTAADANPPSTAYTPATTGERERVCSAARPYGTKTAELKYIDSNINWLAGGTIWVSDCKTNRTGFDLRRMRAL